jgi:hypothetical protein
MKTEVTAAANGYCRVRTRHDATAGGGPPVTGDRFAGDLEGTIERAFLRAGGLSKDEVRRRPIIGICSSWSELNPCNMGLRDLAESVRRGVAAASGTAVVFPTISLNENMIVPTCYRACHYNCVSHGWTKIDRRDDHSVGKGTICESGRCCRWSCCGGVSSFGGGV